MNRIQTLLVALLALAPLGVGPQKEGRPEIRVRSPHSYAETIQRLKDASVAAKFSVVFELDVTARAKEKGIDVPSTMILDVCSAKYASIILADDLRAVPNLPCRIAITEREGKVDVWSLDVTRIAESYGGETMRGVAKEIDTTVRKILADGVATP